MKLDKIILELKKVKTGEQELDSVISVLEKELMESKFINKPSDKKKLSAIKKVVNKSKNGRVTDIENLALTTKNCPNIRKEFLSARLESK